jgi:hypothetical protein
MTGFGFSTDRVFACAFHVALAIFSVVVFATLGCTIGAYFLGREPATDIPSSTAPEQSAPLPGLQAHKALTPRYSEKHT